MGDHNASISRSELEEQSSFESSTISWNDRVKDVRQTADRFRNFQSEARGVKIQKQEDEPMDPHISTSSIISSTKSKDRRVHWFDEVSEESEETFGLEMPSIVSFSEHPSEISDATIIQETGSMISENEGFPEMFGNLRRELLEQEKSEQEERHHRMYTEEKIRRLKEELAALKPLPKPRKQTAWCKGKPHDAAKFPSRRIVEKIANRDQIRFKIDDIDLSTLRPELLANMNEMELKHLITAFIESNPRLRYKENYPFVTEGMFQKDFRSNELKVFSSRLGLLRVPDTRSSSKDNKADYVYFMVLAPGIYRGFSFETHPPSLVSAKFPSEHETVIHGYAILAHPFGTRQLTQKEDCWICWNDSLGAMSVRSKAAMLAMKKQPIWDKQLDVVSIDVVYKNGFAVNKITALTNRKDKEKRFPEEVFIVEDAQYQEIRSNDYVFYSNTLNYEILLERSRVGTAENHLPFEMVVAATFPRPDRLVFRCLLIIPEPTKFWNSTRQWIRDLLRARTDAYRG
ncbi:unnamed protein product [Caenorhabditis brenneri]